MKCHAILVVTLLLFTSGCQNRSAPTAAPNSKTNFADSAITNFHNLGWVGVLGHPLNQPLSFVDPNDPEKTCSPGGLVVRSVIDGSPAAEAGLKTGDVIVGVADEWIPIKDDPTLDFVKQIELQVATGEEETELKVFRAGKCESLSLINIADSLDEGLPTDVVRISDAATRGLVHLARLQNDDGSFSKKETAQSIEAQLQNTALAGMALLSTGDKQFQPNVDQCKSFIGTHIDDLIKASKPNVPNPEHEASKPDQTGVVVMQMASLKMEPLTAAYVLQFLSESNISMMDQEWMPRILAVIGSLKKSQSESGGWNVSSPSTNSNEGNAGDVATNVTGTHTTNQVLLALGMMERNGVMASPEGMAKACGYLKKQMTVRAGDNIDRRLKASLTAGTAVALVSINCQKSDSFMKETFIDGLDKLQERHTSPSHALPGVLSAAILARNAGDDSWLQFYRETKYWLSSVQLPDGSFKTVPGCESAGEIRDAAYYCLLLSMQSTELKKLIGKRTTPMMVARNSDGEKVEGDDDSSSASVMPAGIPKGAQVFKLELGDVEDGSIEEAIRKKLKEQGIDMGDAKIEGIGPPKGAPSGDKKKK